EGSRSTLSSPTSLPASLSPTSGWTRLASATADGSLALPELSNDALNRVYNSGEAESLDLTSFGLTGKFLIYAPLKLGVRSVGVLVLLTSVLEEGTIEAVAGSVAVALERARFLREASHTEALRQSDELKSALLASVSHALRTPLTSMRAAADNLL